ncbi:DNA polymerase III subunit beta [Pseudomonadota bacterium]
MKFLVEKEALVKSLGNVHGSVGKKNATIPILLNVRVEVKSNKLYLTATDLDLAITSTTPVKSGDDGKTTVPAQLFYDIIRKVPDGSEISVELEGYSSLAIKYGKSKFKLPCLSADEFPVIEQGKESLEFKLSATTLREIIDKTRFAVSNDETRYYLNGIYLHSKEVENKNKLRGVATDGHRLAMIEYDGGDKFKPVENGIIIPKKTIQEMRKILEDVGGDVELSISDTKIKIEANDTTMVSKIIDGNFPDYERVIPKDNDKILKVDKKILADAIDRVSTIANDKNRSIKLTIENNLIQLQANTTEGGSADEEVICEYTSDKIETGFNSRYLLDVLMQVTSDKAILSLKDGSMPVLIKGEKEEKTLFVVMPVRC